MRVLSRCSAALAVVGLVQCSSLDCPATEVYADANPLVLLRVPVSWKPSRFHYASVQDSVYPEKRGPARHWSCIISGTPENDPAITKDSTLRHGRLIGLRWTDEPAAGRKLLAEWTDSTGKWAALYSSAQSDHHLLSLFSLFRFVDDEIEITVDSEMHSGHYVETQGTGDADPRKVWCGVKCNLHDQWVFELAVPGRVFPKDWRSQLVKTALRSVVDSQRELGNQVYLKCPEGGHVWPIDFP